MEADDRAVIHKKQPHRMSKWPPIILGLIFLSIFAWNGLMRAHWDGPITRTLTAIVPIPAATVNGGWLTYRDLLKRRDLLVILKGEDADEEKQLAAAMEVIIEQKATEQIASKMGVRLTRDEINAAKDAYEGDRLEMGEREFTNIVLKPLLLAQKLETTILASSDLQAERRAEAEEAKLGIEAGESFATLAQEFSDDPSAATGGDIGYITPATVPEGWDALLTTPEGGITPVMETEREFVIAKVAWLIGVGDNVQIRTQAVIIKKKTLKEVVDEYLTESKVVRYVQVEE